MGLEEGKEAQEVTHELAYQEGKINGRLEERENWTSIHSEGLCTSLELTSQILEEAPVLNDATTQTSSDTNIIFFQLPITVSTSTQTDKPPIPAIPTPSAPLTTPADTATSLPLMFAQPPCDMSLLTTTLTMATRTAPHATTQLQTPRK